METLQAVLVLDWEPNCEYRVLRVVRYAARMHITGGISKLLADARNLYGEEYSPESVIAFADHCVSDGELYRSNGFTKEDEVGPDYLYLFRNKRMNVNELASLGITNLNSLDRIWDAGKTRYRLSL
jgi:hypothetical protein